MRVALFNSAWLYRDFALIFHVINTRKADFVGTASLDATLEIQRNAASVPAEGAAC